MITSSMFATISLKRSPFPSFLTWKIACPWASVPLLASSESSSIPGRLPASTKLPYDSVKGDRRYRACLTHVPADPASGRFDKPFRRWRGRAAELAVRRFGRNEKGWASES
jgi:hypothetical protein